MKHAEIWKQHYATLNVRKLGMKVEKQWRMLVTDIYCSNSISSISSCCCSGSSEAMILVCLCSVSPLFLYLFSYRETWRRWRRRWIHFCCVYSEHVILLHFRNWTNYTHLSSGWCWSWWSNKVRRSLYEQKKLEDKETLSQMLSGVHKTIGTFRKLNRTLLIDVHVVSTLFSA